MNSIFIKRGEIDNQKEKVSTLGQLRFVCFDLGEHTYMISLEDVQEILPTPNITPIPDPPEHIVGVTNIRGAIIPVASMRSLMKYEGGDSNDNSRVLVTNFNELKVGLMIDSVSEIYSLSENEVQLATLLSGNERSSFVTSIYNTEDSTIAIIDNKKVCESLIPKDDTEVSAA